MMCTFKKVVPSRVTWLALGILVWGGAVAFGNDPDKAPAKDAVTAAAEPAPITAPTSAITKTSALDDPESVLFLEIPDVTGSLTDTDRRTIPATVTTLSQEDIRRTGARSVNELLLMTVPNMQMRLHKQGWKHMGLRGIISDREDKWLLLVNGRVMNERTFYGVIQERDLPLLEDIHHIDVVRGAGSSLYGPGAMAMVVNIVTEDSTTFEGTKAVSRIGSIEEFYTGEIKHGRKLGDNKGIFLYGGLNKYPGASGDDAPHAYGKSNGSNYDYEVYDKDTGWNKAFRDFRPKAKVQGDLRWNDLQIWTRYTRGGETWARSDPEWAGMGYQQGTVYLNHTKHFAEDVLWMDNAFSYDFVDVDWSGKVGDPANTMGYLEHEYYGKSILHWKPHKRHQFAFGGEWSHFVLGRDGLGWPSRDEATREEISALGQWSTNLGSVLGEYQWQIAEQWTAFLGGRIDWHTYTEPMRSPRAVLVYTPTQKDTLKAMISRSTRTNMESEMRTGYLTEKAEGHVKYAPVETTDTLEFRHERQHTDHWWFAESVYLHDRAPLGFDGHRNGPLGTIKAWGAEVEATYRSEKWWLTFSHGFTDMCSMKMDDDQVSNVLSAQPYGVGNNYALWDDHCTKARATYFINKQWSVDSTAQVYWGSRGSDEYIKVRSEGLTPDDDDPGEYHDPVPDRGVYDCGFFLDFGLEYKVNDRLNIRADLYNVLGWIDKDFNQRPFVQQRIYSQQYQLEPASVAVRISYTF